MSNLSLQVSIVICTYNRKNLVTRAIDSALAQNEVLLEVIVVDDCSNDGTYENLSKSYGDKIKLVKTDMNSGVSIATNEGYRHCEGDYIALLGDDDYWVDPLKIAKQLAIMEENPRIGVTGTWWVELRKKNIRAEKKPFLPKGRYFIKERMLMSGGVICGSTALVSRIAWEAVSGLDEKQLKGTDSDFFRRIVLSGFDVLVFNDLTTAVDVSHGMRRMTNAEDMVALKINIKSHVNVLRKFFYIWILYPRAFFYRAKIIFLVYIKIAEIYISERFT